jgi:hypothetical protein
MTQRKHILLAFLMGYLTLCLGVATGVTLPGDHSIRGFRPSLALSAFGGSIEARYLCQAKRVQIIGHDTTGSFRAAGSGTLVFEQPGNSRTTPRWAWNRNNPSPDQVIATISTSQTVGRWTVHLEEDPTVTTTFQVDTGPCPASPAQLAPAASPPGSQASTTPPSTSNQPNPAPAPNKSAPPLGKNGLG